MSLPQEQFTVRFQNILHDANWFIGVAAEGRMLLGYVVVQDFGPGLRGSFSVGRMHDMFVNLAHRRRGVGQALMESVQAWASSRPTRLILDWQAPLSAVSFYESLGYAADYEGDFRNFPGFSLESEDV
ncbi:GNAT family N-acetyltransferase [Glutamicibacter uratoxydans]|uniref:GNAT family N-acetyltransferase n=1 Tax=Glutamicibacter uratoxydans TaxID=43667 RepID=UPI0011422B38